MVAATETIPSNTRIPGLGIFYSIAGFFGGSNIDKKVSVKLNEQIRRSLMTDFSALPIPDGTAPERLALYERGIRLLTTDPATWQDIYEAQQIRAHLLPEAELTVALQREMDQGQAIGMDISSVATRLDVGDTSGGLDKSDARAHLVHLVADVSLERHKRHLRRRLRSSYMTQVCRWTLVVGPFFFLSLLLGILTNVKQFSLYEYSYDYMRYPGIFISITSGVLGAWFSMLVSVEKRLAGLSLEELRAAQSPFTLIGRMIFGASAAVIFYFLLRAGLVESVIFPDITKLGFETIRTTTDEARRVIELFSNTAAIYQGDVQGSGTGVTTAIGGFLPSTYMCLLIIWCVICGFSEKLIPTALSRNADAATMGE